MIDETEKETRNWAMILHLSQFAGYVIPLAGFIATIVIWQVKKDQLPGLNQHGVAAVNWMISSVIYLGISIVLSIILIGIPLLILVGLATIVFPIIAAVKASNGEHWKYPASIPFLS